MFGVSNRKVMSIDKSTPGPWRNCSDGIVMQDTNNGLPEIGNQNVIVICSFSDDRHNEHAAYYKNWKANAELIASAPSLKEENEKLKEQIGRLNEKGLRVCEDCDKLESENKRLREALEKIEKSIAGGCVTKEIKAIASAALNPTEDEKD